MYHKQLTRSLGEIRHLKQFKQSHLPLLKKVVYIQSNYKGPTSSSEKKSQQHMEPHAIVSISNFTKNKQPK